jgi:hypothetical protein
MKWRYPSAVIAKPFGTRTPAPVSSRYSSPSDAFLPPTVGTSFSPSSSNHRMNVVSSKACDSVSKWTRQRTCDLRLSRRLPGTARRFLGKAGAALVLSSGVVGTFSAPWVKNRSRAEAGLYTSGRFAAGGGHSRRDCPAQPLLWGWPSSFRSCRCDYTKPSRSRAVRLTRITKSSGGFGPSLRKCRNSNSRPGRHPGCSMSRRGDVSAFSQHWLTSALFASVVRPLSGRTAEAARHDREGLSASRGSGTALAIQRP